MEVFHSHTYNDVSIKFLSLYLLLFIFISWSCSPPRLRLLQTQSSPLKSRYISQWRCSLELETVQALETTGWSSASQSPCPRWPRPLSVASTHNASQRTTFLPVTHIPAPPSQWPAPRSCIRPYFHPTSCYNVADQLVLLRSRPQPLTPQISW